MPDEPRPDVRTVRLGLELRHIRLEQNLTLQKAHKLLRRSVSSISRIEKGQVKLPERDLPPILDAYGITEPARREALLALTRCSDRNSWWKRYKGLSSLPQFLELENEATSIRAFETLFIPGLLQTPAYAYALYSSSGVELSEHKLRQLTNIRMKRRQVLTRPDPVVYDMVLTEGAIRQQVGGPMLMLEQLQHLMDTRHMEHVQLRILPFSAGAHQGSGSFTLLGIHNLGRDVVHVDSTGGAAYRDDDESIRRYTLVFESLRSAALSKSDSLALIEQLLSDLRSRGEGSHDKT
ncbi:helix-turn-helix domain-containing protein [Actinomadura chokoriensis]|uniref:Helix-turn-helix transcriptional regulator n=1 Tax=Actinomadura chokoriensis TaxID=454156 RepID=A0ABV4R479_9ACTN